MTVAMSAMRMGNFEGGFGGIGLTVGGTGGGEMGGGGGGPPSLC